MAVDGVPSSESRWISFRATSSPVWRFRPLKTCDALYQRNGSGQRDEGLEVLDVRLHRYLLRAADHLSVSETRRRTRAEEPGTFSSCWNELGCCVLSIVHDAVLSWEAGGEGGVFVRWLKRNEDGATRAEAISRRAAALSRCDKGLLDVSKLRLSMSDLDTACSASWSPAPWMALLE